jgi:hypothetical protein
MEMDQPEHPGHVLVLSKIKNGPHAWVRVGHSLV